MTRAFSTLHEAEAFAATVPGAWVARDPVGVGWIVVWP